jgi:excisionase family DNA binding protein
LGTKGIASNAVGLVKFDPSDVAAFISSGRISLELLTVSEVCAILRCHEKTLYLWVKRGSLVGRIGSKLKFDPADLAVFLDSRRTG